MSSGSIPKPRESDAYWQGRRARAAGRPRELSDDRFSSVSRQDFFRGWDVEDGFRAEKLSPEQKQKFLAGLAAIRQSL